jgi:hypothetical protein
MTLALSRVEPVTRSWVELMAPAAELAKAVAGTDFVPRALRDRPAAIAACILYGDEVGVGPMQSLATIAVIDGTPYIAAQTQRALVFAAGHDLWLDEATNARATWAGRRKGSENVTRITWTTDDARRAHLDGKPNWRGYPRAMLSARASAELVRAMYADVVAGLAAIEELEEFDPRLVGLPALATAPAEVGGATKPAPAGRRSRTPRRAVASAPVEAAVTVPAAPRPRPPLRPPGLPVDPALGEVSVVYRDVEVDEVEAEPVTREQTLISPAQRRRMMALFTKVGMGGRSEDARALRLRLSADWIGRTVGSSNELTSSEADRIVEQLEQLGEADDDDAPPAGEAPDEVEAPPPVAPVAPPAEDVPLPLADDEPPL